MITANDSILCFTRLGGRSGEVMLSSKTSASSNKFSIDITVTNSASKTIKFLEMMPLRFTFSSMASSWNGNYVMGSNLEGPTMASLEGKDKEGITD